jgi:hypothetical protein
MTKQAKAAYDRRYRKRNKQRIKENHAAYFQATYDPIQAAIDRKKKMPNHVEYCRQPKYRCYKKTYDKTRRVSRFGEFAASYLLLLGLKNEIKRQEPDRFERYRQAGRMAWNYDNQKRRREHAKQKQEKFIKAIGLNSL